MPTNNVKVKLGDGRTPKTNPDGAILIAAPITFRLEPNEKKTIDLGISVDRVVVTFPFGGSGAIGGEVFAPGTPLKATLWNSSASAVSFGDGEPVVKAYVLSSGEPTTLDVTR